MAVKHWMIALGGALILGGISWSSTLKIGYRAPQSEAKVGLYALFTAERYFLEEKKFYTWDIEKVGWASDGANRRYVVGFNPACGARGEAVHSAQISRERDRLAPDTLRILPQIEQRLRMLPCGDPTSNYLAAAVGTLDGSTLDVWTIDQEKSLANPEVGQVSSFWRRFLAIR